MIIKKKMIIKFKLLNKIDFNRKISLKNLKKGGAEKFIIIIKKKTKSKDFIYINYTLNVKNYARKN